MKKMIALVLSCLMLLALFSCAADQPNGPQNSGSPTQSNAPAGPAGGKVSIKISTSQLPTQQMNSAPSFGTFLVTIIPLICSKYSLDPDKWQAIFL